MYIYAFQWEFSLFNLNSCAVELAIPSHENFDVICRLFLLLVYHDMSSNVSFLLMIEEILGSLGWFVLYGCSMLCSDHFHLFFFFLFFSLFFWDIIVLINVPKRLGVVDYHCSSSFEFFL